jgi:hypothetical protein
LRPPSHRMDAFAIRTKVLAKIPPPDRLCRLKIDARAGMTPADRRSCEGTLAAQPRFAHASPTTRFDWLSYTDVLQ